MSNIAIVTGASSGIGEAFVKVLSSDYPVFLENPLDEIWMIARRGDRLAEIKKELDDERVKVVTLDLTSGEGIKLFEKKLQESNHSISLLVNCAGMGKRGTVLSKPYEVLESTLDVNCRSLSVLSRICIPYMKGKEGKSNPKTGARIINIASSAAFLPQPGFASYAASKSYVVSFSRALDIELRPYGIAVTAVCPGPVRTNFQALATDGKAADFEGFRKYVVADPDKLARASLKASIRGRHLYVYKISQKFLHVIAKIIPTFWILKAESLIMPVAQENNNGEE